MSIFKKSQPVLDPLEERLDIISDLTRDLDRKEFNSLLDAVKAMFEVRQKLNKLDSVNEEKKEEKKEDLIEFIEEGQ